MAFLDIVALKANPPQKNAFTTMSNFPSKRRKKNTFVPLCETEAPTAPDDLDNCLSSDYLWGSVKDSVFNEDNLLRSDDSFR